MAKIDGRHGAVRQGRDTLVVPVSEKFVGMIGFDPEFRIGVQTHPSMTPVIVVLLLLIALVATDDPSKSR